MLGILVRYVLRWGSPAGTLRRWSDFQRKCWVLLLIEGLREGLKFALPSHIASPPCGEIARAVARELHESRSDGSDAHSERTRLASGIDTNQKGEEQQGTEADECPYFAAKTQR